ncbi:MAG: hypothetical protein Q9209_001231 [Squamulea sp. 1 TL-2023]
MAGRYKVIVNDNLPPSAFAPLQLPHPLTTRTSLPAYHDRQMTITLSRNVPLSRLYALSNELLLHISSFLPLSSQLSLSITCQHFRRLLHERLGISVILAFSPLTTGRDWTLHPRPEFVCQLEHERQLYLSLVEPLNTATFWCSYCKRQQPNSSFTTRMQHTQRHLRRCRAAEAVMWICPHQQISHETIQSALTGIPQTATCSDTYHQVWITPGDVSIQRTLRNNTSPEQTMLPYSHLKKLMKARHVHICPHLRISDQKVYERAQSNHNLFALSTPRRFKERLKAAARTSKMQMKRLGRTPGTYNPVPAEENICKKCETRWHWEMRDHRFLYLVIHRPFAEERVGVGHPRWINQAMPPEEGERLEREWEDDERAFEVQMAWENDERICKRYGVRMVNYT